MQQTQKNEYLRELFVLELMAFSPKYNHVLAERIADQFDDNSLERLLPMLQKINDQTVYPLVASQVAETSNEKPAREREDQEKRFDDSFFSHLEAQLTKDQEKMADLDTLRETAEEDFAQVEAAIEKNAVLARKLLEFLLPSPSL